MCIQIKKCTQKIPTTGRLWWLVQTTFPTSSQMSFSARFRNYGMYHSQTAPKYSPWRFQTADGVPLQFISRERSLIRWSWITKLRTCKLFWRSNEARGRSKYWWEVATRMIWGKQFLGKECLMKGGKRSGTIQFTSRQRGMIWLGLYLLRDWKTLFSLRAIGGQLLEGRTCDQWIQESLYYLKRSGKISALYFAIFAKPDLIFVITPLQ